MQNQYTINSHTTNWASKKVLNNDLQKIPSIHKIINFLLILGMLLIPFSTTSGRLTSLSITQQINSGSFSSLPVLSFGLPFLMVASVLVIISILGRDTVFPKQGFILYFFCIISIFVSLLFSPNLTPALFRFIIQLGCMVLSLYIASLNRYNEALKKILLRNLYLAFIVSGFLLALYFMFNTINAINLYGLSILITERGVGMLLSLPWGASNMISSVLLMPFFVCLAWLNSDFNKNIHYIIWIILISMFISIVLTLSRTTITILLLSLFVYGALSRSLKLIVFITSFLFVCYVTIQLYIDSSFIYDLYWQRLANADELLQANGRVEIWQKYIQYISSNYLIPIGYYGAIYKYKFSGHNFFLTTMVEQSLWGVLASLAIYFWAARLTIRRYLLASLEFKNFHLALLMGLLAVFANLQFEDANYTQQFAVYHWAYLGLLFVNIGEQKQEKGAENSA